MTLPRQPTLAIVVTSLGCLTLSVVLFAAVDFASTELLGGDR